MTRHTAHICRSGPMFHDFEGPPWLTFNATTWSQRTRASSWVLEQIRWYVSWDLEAQCWYLCSRRWPQSVAYWLHLRLIVSPISLHPPTFFASIGPTPLLDRVAVAQCNALVSSWVMWMIINFLCLFLQHIAPWLSDRLLTGHTGSSSSLQGCQSNNLLMTLFLYCTSARSSTLAAPNRHFMTLQMANQWVVSIWRCRTSVQWKGDPCYKDQSKLQPWSISCSHNMDHITVNPCKMAVCSRRKPWIHEYGPGTVWSTTIQYRILYGRRCIQYGGEP